MTNYRKKSQTIWEIENSFYLKSDKSRINKVICHYEIFKKILKTPGSIVECGVFKGISLIRFLTFRDLYGQTLKKKIIGFDVFGKFPEQFIKEDDNFAKNHNLNTGLGYPIKLLKEYLKKKKFKNFELIKGKVEDTLQKYLKKNKSLKISLLHLDLDVYEPTAFALSTLYSKVSKNGLILIDDYRQVKGATKATDKFLKKHKHLKIERLSFDKRLFFIRKT